MYQNIYKSKKQREKLFQLIMNKCLPTKCGRIMYTLLTVGSRFIGNLNFYPFNFGCFLQFSIVYLYYILVSEGGSYKKD